MKEIKRLNLMMSAGSRNSWNYLLQKGFGVTARSGLTVRDFLFSVLGYSDDVIDGDIRTIFLNNSPVDDIDSVHVKNGDRLALGSAMPGLVGIVMGRDNPFKSFRKDISAVEDSVEARAEDIRVSVKIFSTLAVDTGEEVMRRGIIFSARSLTEHLGKDASQVLDANGQTADEVLAELKNMDDDVRVTIQFE